MKKNPRNGFHNMFLFNRELKEQHYCNLKLPGIYSGSNTHEFLQVSQTYCLRGCRCQNVFHFSEGHQSIDIAFQEAAATGADCS